MNERIRRPHESFGPAPGGPRDILSGTVDTRGSAMVSHGPYSETLPVGGMTVSEIRRRFHDRFDIDPQSQAIIDGHEADDSTKVQPGQHLGFIRKAGEKGR